MHSLNKIVLHGLITKYKIEPNEFISKVTNQALLILNYHSYITLKLTLMIRLTKDLAQKIALEVLV